jgi:ketosteroid isomerase-like protein
MRNPIAIVLAGLMSLSMFSCAPKEPDMTVLRKTVDTYNEASKEAMLSGNSEKIMNYYEEGAMQMSPNAPMIKGKDAIRAMQDQMSKMGMKFNSVAFRTLEVEAGGKVAFEIGTYDMTITMPQMGQVTDKGKYIALWRQQQDGIWKIHAETWNSDQAPPPMGHEDFKSSSKKK